jgi:hypothetical protein
MSRDEKSAGSRKTTESANKEKHCIEPLASGPLIERKGRTMKNIKQCPKQIEKSRTSRWGIQNYH